jgi:hypothetical protein
MLAHPFKKEKHSPAGMFVSEKLDGHRAIVIPGTRGLLKKNVPFANLYDAKRHDQVCSGVWSRYGNVIPAPDSWLDDLPQTFLDGELWLGRNTRQKLASIIKQLVPDEDDWDDVEFYAFDMPSPEKFFANRYINLTNFPDKTLSGCLEWWEGLNTKLDYRPKPATQFQSTVILLERYCSGRAIAHKQFQLAYQRTGASEQLDIIAEKVEAKEGEGLILRDPASIWVTERSWKNLKVKKLKDAEGIVLGYTTGKETEKGSKLLGLMGALILNFEGRRFELSGFTNAERALGWTQGECRAEATATPTEWAQAHPGKEVPEWIEAPEFPRGSSVTFKYRDLTVDELPNEARYWRKDVRI